MNKFVKRSMLVMMVFLLCFSTINWNVFAENNFSAYAVDDNITVRIDEPVNLQVVVNADDTSLVTYKWQKYDNANHVWVEIPGDESTLLVSEHDKVVYEEFICNVDDGYGNQNSIYFRVFLSNELTTPSTDYYLSFTPGESFELSPDISAIDETVIKYQWYIVNDGTGESEEINGATEKNYAPSKKGTYRLVVDDTVYAEDLYILYHVDIINDLWINADQYDYYFDKGSSVTITVNPTAIDTSNLTYVWSRRIDDTYSLIENENSSSLVCTESGIYNCTVHDQYGNLTSSDFTVHQNNNLYAKPVNVDGYVNVEYGATAQLQVDVSADDLNGITYTWYKVEAEGTYVVENETTQTLSVENNTKSCTYYCEVSDRFFNTTYAYFFIQINNNFYAYAKGTESSNLELTLFDGDSVVLEVIATADNPEFSYTWYSEAYIDEVTGEWNDGRIDGNNSPILTIDNVDKSTTYRCEIRDLYENERNVYFYIRYISSDMILVLDEEKTFDFKLEQNEYDFMFVPETTGGYLFTVTSNNDAVLDLRDKDRNWLTNGVFDGSTMSLGYNLIAGKTYILCVMFYEPCEQTIKVQKVPSKTVRYFVDNELITTKEINEYDSNWNIWWNDDSFSSYRESEDRFFRYWTTSRDLTGEAFSGEIVDNTDLYAVFGNYYTVTYIADGVELGTIGKNEEGSNTYAWKDISDFSSYTADPRKVFSHWSNQENGDWYWEGLTDDLTVYAVFEEAFLVNYHDQNGELIQSMYVTESNWNRRADEFDHQWLDDDLALMYWVTTINGDDQPSNISEGDNLYAVVGKKNPVIFFDPNGGSLGGQNSIVLNNNYAWDIDFTQINAPERTGYTFAGWSMSENDYIELKPYERIKSDMTLYAYWVLAEKAEVKVTLKRGQTANLDGLDATITGDGIYDVGDTVTVNVKINDDYYYFYDYRTESGYSLEYSESFIAKEGIKNIEISVERGNYDIRFITDERDPDNCYEILKTNRFGEVVNFPEMPEREGMYLKGWSISPNSDDYMTFSGARRYGSFEGMTLYPVWDKSDVEVSILPLFYLNPDRESDNIYVPDNIDYIGATTAKSGEWYSFKLKLNDYSAGIVVTVFDEENNYIPVKYVFDGFNNVEKQYTHTNDTLEGSFLVPSKNTVLKFQVYDKLVTTIMNPNTDLIKNYVDKDSITYSAGERVVWDFDIPEGYAIDNKKPFINFETKNGNIVYEGSIWNYETVNLECLDLSVPNRIAWKAGYGEVWFTPNIIFVGYNTQTEQDISDILDTNGEDEYSAPGIVFYNESSEAKSYTVDFTKPGNAQESGEIHSAGTMAKRGLLKSSVVEPVEGEDGIGSYVLYVTTGKVGEAGTKLEPIHVANLKSLNVTVEAGEFVTYSVVPDEGNETEINDIQFEVKDEEENVVQTGYISTDDTSKHLVYEEAAATQTPVNYVGTSLDLDGIINMNFYFKVPEEYEGAYAVLKDEMGNRTEVDLSTVPYSDKNGYKVTYPNIVAKRMMMKIELTVCDKDGNVIPMERKGSLLPNGTFSYCVTDYVNDVLMTSSRAYSKDLAYAILNYGQCAQEYFGYETDKPMPNPLGYLASEMAEVEADPQYTQTGPEWDQYIGASLDLEGAISSYLYFRVPITATRVNSDGTESALPVVQNANGYRVEIRNIAAKRLHEMYTIRVKYEGNTYEYRTGVFSYVNRVLIPKPEANKSNLGKAFYLYNRAARLYFNY